VRARVYLRISDADRLANGERDTTSTDNQVPPCLKLAEAKGWDVDPRPYQEGGDLYVDIDVSASRKPGESKSKRAKRTFSAYDAFITATIADAEAGRHVGIIGWDADRLTRDPRENEDFIDVTEKYGIQLATVTGDYDLATAAGRLAYRIKGAIAAHESEHRAERVRLKHGALRAAGKFHGGQRSFGYHNVPMIVDGAVRVRVELHEEEAAHIRAAANRIRTGGSLSAITREWNTSGILRPRGRLWTTDRVRELLTGPRIAGLRQNGTDVVDADWPAIISRHDWEVLRAILGPSPTHKGPKEPREYLASGVLVCERCRVAMIGQARMGTPAYACRRERGGCGRLHRMAKPIDDYLRDVVLDQLSTPQFRARLEIHYGQGADDEAVALVAERDAALARLKQLRDALADGTIELDDFAHAKQRLQVVIDTTTAKLSTLQRTNALADLPDTRDELEPVWERADQDQRRAMLRLVVSSVIVKAPGGGVRFKPDQADISFTV
jgi:site-specific DNA recombinase